MHYLWETARLNVWQPGHRGRSWSTCREALDDQARDCRINRQELSQVLWIVPPFRLEAAEQLHAAWNAYLARLTSSGRERRRGLVLGEIRRVEPTDHGVRIRLAHQRTPLYASTAVMERVRHSYPAVFSQHAEERRRRQVVLCLIERSRNGYASLVDAAAMLTTETYLPADSSFECEMADALVGAERMFVKPLRYAGEEVFPDFVLTDTEPHTSVEVWGVRGRESYEERRRVKQELYRRAGRPLIEWDVRDPLPNVAR